MKNLLVISSLLLLFFSCKDKEEYYSFTDDDRKLIPNLKNGDTISYFRKGENIYDEINEMAHRYETDSNAARHTIFATDGFTFRSNTRNGSFQSCRAVHLYISEAVLIGIR